MEIILVDDGSSDRCPQICDEYGQKYDFVRVIHKENGGASSARNKGIDAAEGKYIIFMDSDDWWNPNINAKKIIEQVKRQEDVEMFLFSSLDYIDGKGFFKRKEHDNLNAIRTDTIAHYYSDLLKNGNLEVAPTTKITKKTFLCDNDLYFKIGITGEDNEWMIRILRVLKKVEIIPEPLYCYRLGRSGSVTNSIGIRNILDLLDIVKESVLFYKNKDAPYKKSELCFAAYLWFSALGLSASLDKNARKGLKEEFDRTRMVCNYSTSKKTRLCTMVYKVAGYEWTVYILGKYISLKHKRTLNRTKVMV
jgi:glycosyltransferase involved in cell wall biosynthesis